MPKRLLFHEGLDVTDVLGVKKWERADAEEQVREPTKKTPKKKYPKFLMKMKWFRKLVLKRKYSNTAAFPTDYVSKTDEIRIQNAPFYLEDKDPWYFTEKIDGTSGTYLLIREHGFIADRYDYMVCSRNNRRFDEDSIYWQVSKKYDIQGKLKLLMAIFGVDWIALQGECVGPSVQGNRYHLSEPDIYVFNLITPNGRLSTIEMARYIEMVHMKSVPIVNCTTLPNTVEDMLALAHNKSELADVLREGLVCRSMDGKKSFKAVDPEYLMLHDE